MTANIIALAVMVIVTAIFIRWARSLKPHTHEKPVLSTTLVGMADENGHYYEVEVRTGRVNDLCPEDPIATPMRNP